jgi:hypothetical protein
MALTAEISDILVKADPIQIYYPEHRNTDEYDSEASDIANGLSSCDSYDACLDLVHRVFVDNFGQSIAGERTIYASIAAAIWALPRD